MEAASTAKRFFIRLGGIEHGPLSKAEVEDLHGSHKIDRSTPCRASGDNHWLTVYDLVPSAIWVSSPRAAPKELAVPVSSNGKGGAVTSSTGFRIAAHAVGLMLFLVVFNALLDAAYPPPAESSQQRFKKLMDAVPRPAPSNPTNLFAPMAQMLEEFPKHISRTLDYTALELKEIQRQHHRDVITLIVFGTLGFIFWLWMLLAVSLREPPGSEKIVWVLIVVLTGPIGAAIYYFARYPRLPNKTALPAP